MPEIVPLKSVPVRRAWPNEARDFTPWLSQNLNLLSKILGFDLKLIKTEKWLAEFGRVDILAERLDTKTKVVIENQLETSDQNHLAHLLGYATKAKAGSVIWIASDFMPYYRDIVSWLNEISLNKTSFYLVEVKVYDIGNRLAVDFRLADQFQVMKNQILGQRTGNAAYGRFYRPIVDTLRLSGLAPSGQGGWRGRYRSFQTGYPGIVYFAQMESDEVMVGVWLYGRPDALSIYQALEKYRSKMDLELGDSTHWYQENEGFGFVLRKLADTDQLEEKAGAGQWMVDNLVKLQGVVQPYLDKVMNNQ